jgi:hypothetical protein
MMKASQICFQVYFYADAAKIALVLVRLNRVARFIVNANPTF